MTMAQSLCNLKCHNTCWAFPCWSVHDFCFRILSARRFHISHNWPNAQRRINKNPSHNSLGGMNQNSAIMRNTYVNACHRSPENWFLTTTIDYYHWAHTAIDIFNHSTLVWPLWAYHLSHPHRIHSIVAGNYWLTLLRRYHDINFQLAVQLINSITSHTYFFFFGWPHAELLDA